MAKINIELNLEDLGSYFDEESGTIDFESFMSDEIQSQISSKIVSKIEDKQIKKIEKHISESLEGLVSKLESKLDEKVNEITENLLNRNITIYDKWGDKVKENVNIMDMFKQKMDNFLTEKVNSRGESTGYDRNQTRIDYLVNKNITFGMERKVNEAAQQVSKKIEEYVNKTLKEQIGEEVSKVIGLDKITSKINGGNR
ncbi:hypothetical protein FDB14_15195 [Clostridium botulinum]|nr:hypothetical protein [Clostridium botulinum]NFK69173.1 hypothetical protein [Clostridium botulinum]NFK97522.1 hypothetical protein [Clostridium botulinum]